jgi:hypothetical protein
MNYQHLLSPRRDGFVVVHVESNCHVGYADRRGTKYRVRNDYGDDIAIVSSIDKAIPALLAYYEKHPPRWERDCATEYSKLSPFGLLEVEEDQSGHWSAYRNEHPLLRDSKPAIFATSVEAQRAADAHLRDGLPDSEPNNNGMSWASDPEIE